MRHPDVIVVDPPRKGCDEQCLSTMLAMRPERIVYVSCDSATLARDLRILVDGGYELQKVRAFDQFAHTGHVETVVLLSKGIIDSQKVKVEMSLEVLPVFYPVLLPFPIPVLPYHAPSCQIIFYLFHAILLIFI